MADTTNTLMRSDPRDVARIVQLSRLTYRKMIQNLWWAAGYNILAIPLAAGILASRGFVLSPAIAAVLMSASTVIVAANAQLLRRASLTWPMKTSTRCHISSPRRDNPGHLQAARAHSIGLRKWHQ